MQTKQRYIIYIFFAMILWFILHIVYLLYDGLTDELAVVDVAVVLGSKIKPNGKPTRGLQGRLDEALVLYKQGYFKKIIVSGAAVKEGFVEAEVMAKHLREHGIPEGVLIVDDRARNTFETAVNTKRIIEEHGWKSLMIITQAYHITRTKLAFRRVGIKRVFAAHAHFFEWGDIYSTIREFFGYYKYLFMEVK